MDISKAIDKAARGVPQGKADPTSPNHGKYKSGCSEDNPTGRGFGAGPGQFMKQQGESISRELVPEAQEWDGWGTALKPANEPIVLARKPLGEKTVAANVLKWGTGGINIDGCRVSLEGEKPPTGSGKPCPTGNADIMSRALGKDKPNVTPEQGRFPANIILDEEAAAVLGEPARFFYCAKASKAERGEGNTHPTVKPLKLMSYLIKLITPPGGTVLDPFMGSGSTGIAANGLGYKFIGIDNEAEYIDIARRRMGQVSTF